MKDGELLLMDMSAEFAHYASDITRTVPVSGKFTPEQRKIYELVLKAQTEAFNHLKPGVYSEDLDAIALSAKQGRSSAVGLYVTCFYAGGSVGAFLPGLTWASYGWPAAVAMLVAMQTIIAPMVTTLLYFAVFILALGGQSRQAVAGVGFTEFLAPGLIMMAMTQNAFANTSSSLMIAKIQGNIVDVLMPPLSPGELTLGFAAGGVSRGLMVGLAVGLTMWIFVPVRIHDPALVLFHAVAAEMEFAGQ